MAGIKESIKQKEQEIAKCEDRISDIVARRHSDLAINRETLSDRLPQQVIDYHLKELARCFSNAILEQYGCLSIKNPEDVHAIIERLTMDNFEIGKSWAIPAARAIRGFIAQTHSVYRSTPPHHLLLAHICERFNKVILLEGEKEPYANTAVPQQVREVLRAAHKLTEIPSYL